MAKRVSNDRLTQRAKMWLRKKPDPRSVYGRRTSRSARPQPQQQQQRTRRPRLQRPPVLEPSQPLGIQFAQQDAERPRPTIQTQAPGVRGMDLPDPFATTKQTSLPEYANSNLPSADEIFSPQPKPQAQNATQSHQSPPVPQRPPQPVSQPQEQERPPAASVARQEPPAATNAAEQPARATYERERGNEQPRRADDRPAPERERQNDNQRAEGRQDSELTNTLKELVRLMTSNNESLNSMHQTLQAHTEHLSTIAQKIDGAGGLA